MVDPKFTREDLIKIMDGREVARALVNMANRQPSLYDRARWQKMRTEAWRYIGTVNRLVEGKLEQDGD